MLRILENNIYLGIYLTFFSNFSRENYSLVNSYYNNFEKCSGLDL